MRHIVAASASKRQRRDSSVFKHAAGPVNVDAYAPIDVILPAALPLNLAYPVDIDPPATKGGPWVVRSDNQNRMVRDTYSMDPMSGRILAKATSYDRPLIERITSIGISAHEGHLFGWLNQALGVFTAVSLILVSISSVALWWGRRPEGLLGAPKPKPHPLAITAGLCPGREIGDMRLLFLL